MNLDKTTLKSVNSAFNKAVKSAEEILDPEVLVKASQIYRVFIEQTASINFLNFGDNNFELAKVSIEVARKGEIRLWRYVCMPFTQIIIENGEFIRWECEIGNPRYDTLTKSLGADQKVMKVLNQVGIRTDIQLIINDWEVPFLRCKDWFYTLSKYEQYRALKDLEDIRELQTEWIRSKCSEEYQIEYFSSFVEYDEFCAGVDLCGLELDESKGIVRSEVDFVLKANDTLNYVEAVIKSLRRVAQYAVESTFLKGFLPLNSVYLSSEYPHCTSL